MNPSEDEIKEAFSILENLTTNHPVPVIGAVHAKVLARVLTATRAELAILKQNKRIVETVDSLVGPESAKLVEATLVAVDRAEAAEKERDDLRAALTSKSLALEGAVKALEGIASEEDCCCLAHDHDNLCCITELGLRRMCEEALAAIKTAQEVKKP